MSRYVRRSRLVALVVLGAAALSAPALADVTPLHAGDPCTQWSARNIPACRVGMKSAKRQGIRPAFAETRRPIVVDAFVPVAPRYVSLLILGVGF